MSEEASQAGKRVGDAAASVSDLIHRLNQFAGPPNEFLGSLLAVQCELASAAGGAILRAAGGDRLEAVALFPEVRGAAAPVWLAHAMESGGTVMSGGVTAVQPLHGPEELYGQPARRHLVMIPLKGGQDKVRGLAVFEVEAVSSVALARSLERLELTVSLLSLYEIRLTLQKRQGDLRRLRMAMELLAAVNEQSRFAGTAMTLCNEVAARWQCERVSLGFLKGRYVQVAAMSHTEKFSRKMKIVQDLEAAMEECLDQDVEIVHPAAEDAPYVSRAVSELSRRHGPIAALSLPLRSAGEPVAVLTAEWAAGKPVSLEEVEPLRLACDLCTARLVELRERDRWFGARMAAGVRKSLAVVLSPRHTWAKAAAILVIAAAAFLYFGKGDYQAEAPFVLQAAQRQVVPAPFEGFLEDVLVDPGDDVVAGRTVLAKMDGSALRLQRGSLEMERMTSLKQAAVAMRDGKTAEAQIANAQADKTAARIRLLDYQIDKAEIVAPLSGKIVEGDLQRNRGAPLKTGEILFQIAPLGSLRAELSVPEDEIADVEVGQEGELAVAAMPDRRVPFVVERINPVAEVVDRQNVFKVRARFQRTEPWMRPGMEGSAKVSIGKRRYAWLWSRRAVNWLRMKLWM